MNGNGPEAIFLVVEVELNIRELLSKSLRFSDFGMIAGANGRDHLAEAQASDLSDMLTDLIPSQRGVRYVLRTTEKC